MKAKLQLARRLKQGMWVLLAVCTTAACGPPPRVLIDQQFVGEKRVARVFMQRNGDVFDQHLRICTIGQSGQESDCKDSLILDKVIPGSLY
jgi:hypothetical protein